MKFFLSLFFFFFIFFVELFFRLVYAREMCVFLSSFGLKKIISLPTGTKNIREHVAPVVAKNQIFLCIFEARITKKNKSAEIAALAQTKAVGFRPPHHTERSHHRLRPSGNGSSEFIFMMSGFDLESEVYAEAPNTLLHPASIQTDPK